ncbi:hypothetical protein ATANTOWER_004966 [Ataeniobius toweri]|uniref:Uncharacterized protein n=1 Tax=Ataeniobius toweri TaxID=208326 RepID=A0ABU7BZT4_9TELE|nr:hypothetical protein [Ataeniobius toweri]
MLTDNSCSHLSGLAVSYLLRLCNVANGVTVFKGPLSDVPEDFCQSHVCKSVCMFVHILVCCCLSNHVLP